MNTATVTEPGGSEQKDVRVERPQRPYFTGKPTNLGLVERTSSQTFKDFAHNHLLLAAALNVTRDQYHSLEHPKQQEAKRVGWFTPCWFDFDHGERNKLNARGVSLICLDVDDHDAARPYRNGPQTLFDQLGEYSFCLYETATSTQDKPKVRLILDACLPVEMYKEAVYTVATRIGLPAEAVNSETLRYWQPMYFPTMFADDTNSHPLLSHNLDGRRFTVEDIFTTDRPAQPSYVPADALDFLRSPVHGLLLKDVESALQHIDPDVGYDQWLGVAAALKHQFARTPDEDDAFTLFDTWSAKGKKYAGEGDTKAKWASLKANPVGRLPVTARSLLHLARESGWAGLATTQRIVDAFLGWLNGSAALTKDFATEGIKRLAGLPELSPMEEEILLKALSRVIADRQHIKVNLKTLRSEVRLLRKHAADKLAKERHAKQAWPKWALGLCYVEGLDMFYRAATASLISPQALDRSHGRYLVDTPEKDMVAQESGAKAPRAGAFLLNTVKCPVAWDIIYDPTRPDRTRVLHNAQMYVNTYVRCHPEPDERQAAYAEEVLLEHMRKLLGDKEYVDTVLDFMTYMVQCPGGKIRWTMLIQGAEGCGKSALSNVMEAVLGKRHVNQLRYSSVTKGWSDWAVGYQLVTLEEVRVSGANRRELMDLMKPLITNDTVSIDRKYKDTLTVPNYTNYIMYSNHHDALLLGPDDRRYCVIWSPIQSKRDIRAAGMDGAYFDRFFGMLRTHAAGLRHFFENRTISSTFNPNGPAPVTRFRDLLVEESMLPTAQSLSDAIASNRHPLLCDDACSTRAVGELLALEGLPPSPTMVGAALRACGFSPVVGRWTLEDGNRHRLYVRSSDVVTCGEEPLTERALRTLNSRLAVWAGTDNDMLGLL